MAWARFKLFKERGWIASADRGSTPGVYHIQNRINGHSEWPPRTPGVNIPMLNGDQRIQIEKQQYLSDWQQVVPSAVIFFRYTPTNMYSTNLEGPDQQFCGWRAATAYVFPFDTPTTRMDSQSAERFLALLRARNIGALKTALSALGLRRQDDAEVLPGELSIERLAHAMSGFCACFKLCQKYKGFQYLGTCRIFCRMGTCPHELCARYLDADPELSLACLSDWTRAQTPESLSVADVQLRAKQQNVVSQSPVAAGSTLHSLMLRAQARMQKQVDKGSTKRKAVASLLESPSKKRKKSTILPLVDLESRRSKLLQKLAQHIDDGTWGVCFQAILTCTKEKVSVSEAKQFGIDTKLTHLLDRDASLPMKSAGNALRQVWLVS